MFSSPTLAETPPSTPACPNVPAVSWKGGANASPSALASRWNRLCACGSPASCESTTTLPSQTVQAIGSGCPSFHNTRSFGPAEAAVATQRLSESQRTPQTYQRKRPPAISVDVHAVSFDVQLRVGLDVGLLFHRQIERAADVDLAGLLGLDLEVFALEDDLLLGVNLDVAFLGLDEIHA